MSPLRERLRVVRAGGDSGVALVVVLGTTMVMTLLVVALSGYALSGYVSAKTDTDWNASIAAAQAGVDDYIAHLNEDPNYWSEPDETNPALSGWTPVPGSTNGAEFRYEVLPGNTVATLAVVQQAVAAVERSLGVEDDSAEAQAKRARIEFRLDSGWGSEALINWLLARGYQVTGKFKSTARVQKLVRPISAWEPTTSPGREGAPVLAPIALARPCAPYAVRTPSKDKAGGYYQAVLFSSRLELGMQGLVDHYDGRAGMEADLKGDKRGLGLGGLRKHKLAAQRMVVLLGQWAHNVLLWSRCWLARGAPRLAEFGIVRLVQEVCAVPGRVKLTAAGVTRVRLRPEHPCARDVYRGLRPLCPSSQTLAFLG